MSIPHSFRTVIGIDPSLTSTGIAVIRQGLLTTRRIQPPKLTGPRRLDYFFSMFKGLCAVEQPALVALEGYAFGAKAHHHALGELGGILRLALHQAEQNFIVVPPTSLKLFVTGKGNSEKGMISKELYKRFAIDLSNNDEADAAGLALMALAQDGTTVPLPVTHLKALAKVEWFGGDAVPLQPVAKTLDKESNPSYTPLKVRERVRA